MQSQANKDFCLNKFCEAKLFFFVAWVDKNKAIIEFENQISVIFVSSWSSHRRLKPKKSVVWEKYKIMTQWFTLLKKCGYASAFAAYSIFCILIFLSTHSMILRQAHKVNRG